MSKIGLTKWDWILTSFLAVLAGLGIYSMGADQARSKLVAKLEMKVNMITDVNLNNHLEIEEMKKVYENLGLNPADELRKRGFNLKVEEMQQYLKNTGNFNSKTDVYSLKDGFR